MKKNLILNTDSYKPSHFLQYPQNMTYMHSYLSSRGGRYGKTMFFGLQHLLKEYLSSPITKEDIQEAEQFLGLHGEPFNKADFEYLLDRHGGYLPLRIRAVAEGTMVPTHNVLATVESTDERLAWMVSYVEDLMVRLWYPITVATQSWHIKQIIREYLQKTANDPEGELGFKLHDFGARGVSSNESAGIGGMAHLVNFLGSDTIEGVRYANHYYGCEMAGFSIPASEHSTITSWGKQGELAAFQNMVRQFGKPGKMFACVSDSYDYFNALENFWCENLKDELKASGSTLVIRPDSGDPAKIILQSLQVLERKLGMTVNMKQYKVLPSYVRLIQGDGVNEDSIREILHLITSYGYSASNIAFGSGGALLQKLDRDTQRFAYKTSEVVVDGVRVPVFKDPVTDPGKKSISGRLDLLKDNGEFRTVQVDTPNKRTSQLVSVFENGNILKEYSLDEVRANSNKE